jgi:hypothetical protein
MQFASTLPLSMPLAVMKRRMVTEAILPRRARSSVLVCFINGVIDRVARDNPEKILEVMARVLPKELAVTVEQRTPGNLEPEAWAALRRVLDIIEACKVPGEPRDVFAMIEEDLRARIATPVQRE